MFGRCFDVVLESDNREFMAPTLVDRMKKIKVAVIVGKRAGYQICTDAPKIIRRLFSAGPDTYMSFVSVFCELRILIGVIHTTHKSLKTDPIRAF